MDESSDPPQRSQYITKLIEKEHASELDQPT